MPEETKTAEQEAAKADETQSQRAQKASEASQKEEEKKDETQKAAQGTTESVELKSIVRDAEGNFVWVVNPEDPKTSTVYKGATLDELFSNVGKGITAKDSYIQQLKAKGLSPGTRETVTGDADFEIESPDYGQILEQSLRESRVDPKFLSFSKEDWKQYEVENGAVETIETKQAVRDAKRTADTRYSEMNVRAINDSTLSQETEGAEEILAEYGIEAAEFEGAYDSILKSVYEDKKNFNAAGVLKSGRIVSQVAKEAKKLFESKMRNQIETKKDEETALGKHKKVTISTESSSRKEFNKVQDKTYKNTEDVVADILREARLKT